MDLKEYLNKKRGLRKALSDGLKLPPQNITNWVSGNKRVPIKHAVMIEKLTHHIVRMEDMRPEIDWSVLRSVA